MLFLLLGGHGKRPPITKEDMLIEHAYATDLNCPCSAYKKHGFEKKRHFSKTQRHLVSSNKMSFPRHLARKECMFIFETLYNQLRTRVNMFANCLKQNMVDNNPFPSLRTSREAVNKNVLKQMFKNKFRCQFVVKFYAEFMRFIRPISCICRN